MFFVYRILINLVFILSPIIFFYRIIKKKEDIYRFKEKLCFFSKKKIKGNTVWFHGASVGEVLSIVPMIEKLEKNKKINQILVTTNTLSSSKILTKLKLKKTIHQFFPIDTNYHTRKFLNYWNPSIALFVDSEIWPNMITNINKKKISLILINARITKKTFYRWIKFPQFAKNLFNKFDACYAASSESKKYLKKLGAKNILNIGNLKFTQIKGNNDTLNKNLKKILFSRKIWCASSTHNSEEIICAITHRELKKKYKNLLTIIIPRHINRTSNIISELKKYDLKVCTHSSSQKIDKDTDIYLVDSYGETKLFYKICKIIFLGGSLIKHGGQNPLEPAMYGCKTLHGPNIWNFKEIYGLLHKNNISKKVKNSKELVSEIHYFFNNKDNYKNIKQKIKKIGDKVLNSTLKEVTLFINKK